jgi:hypothetical protein
MFLLVGRRASLNHGKSITYLCSANRLMIFIRHRAGHLSQGYPGGKAIRMRVKPPQTKHKFKPAAYVVFEGLMPGIYDTW